MNGRLGTGETVRVFPMSNWTEKDVWRYILRENLAVVPLYLAKERPVIVRNGQIIMQDDDRLQPREGEKVEMRKIRFRTLGCYPLTAAIESDADRSGERRRRNDQCTDLRARRPAHRS